MIWIILLHLGRHVFKSLDSESTLRASNGHLRRKSRALPISWHRKMKPISPESSRRRPTVASISKAGSAETSSELSYYLSDVFMVKSPGRFASLFAVHLCDVILGLLVFGGS